VGPGDSFPETKRLERESVHSSLSSADLKNQWSYTSIFSISFLDVDSESFTFCRLEEVWVQRVLSGELIVLWFYFSETCTGNGMAA
jgi:hypothetical protein